MKKITVALLAATLALGPLVAVATAAPAPGNVRSPLLTEVQQPTDQTKPQTTTKKKKQTASKKPSTSDKQTASKKPTTNNKKPASKKSPAKKPEQPTSTSS